MNPLQPFVKAGETTSEYYKDMDESQKLLMKKSNHLLALASSNEGYKNLVKMSSWGWEHGFYRKPRINYDVIKKHKEGVIFTSCCYNSEIGQAFDRGGDDEGFSMVERYIEMFGKENFYFAIMLLDFSKQKPYNVFVQKACHRYGLNPVLEQDCHYCNKEDSKYQRYMLMIQTGKTISEIEATIAAAEAAGEAADVFELQDSNLWMKSEEEINEMYLEKFQDTIDLDFFEQAKRNTVKICNQCKGVSLDRSIKLPKIANEKEELKKAIIEGFTRRGLPKTQKYLDRVKEEYNLICEKEFCSYFLIQKMQTDEARRWWGVETGGSGADAVGPGRGCESPETPIIMEYGHVKAICDVVPGDKVLTRDGTLHNVIKRFEFDCCENLINIKCFYGDKLGVSLTSDHRVLVQKGQRPNNWDFWAVSTKKSRRAWVTPKGKGEWIPAENIDVGDWVFCPKPIIDIQEHTGFDLAFFCKDESKESFDEEFVYEKIQSNSFSQPTIRKINRHLKLDQNLALIFGLFTGDGWWESNNRSTISIAFHSENDDWGKHVFCYWLKSVGVPFSVLRQKGKKVVVIKARSRIICRLFEFNFPEYKCKSSTKHIPNVFFSQNTDLRFSYLKGYFLSDGSSKDGKIKLTTTSQKLQDQMRFLSWSLGIPASRTSYNRHDKRSGYNYKELVSILPYTEGLTINDCQKQYVFQQADDGIWLQVRETSEVTDVNKVYDLQVEDEHNYMTSSFLVHNSGPGSLVNYLTGVTDVDPIRHDLLFSRFLSPARGGKTIKTRFKSSPLT